MATKNLGRVVGYSAYEIWLQQGNEGTIDDYLNSLKGGPGNDGHTPVKGEDYFTEEDIQSLNIPTKTSELENDSNYITEEELNEATANVVTSYNDLTDKPFGEEIKKTALLEEGFTIGTNSSFVDLYNVDEEYIIIYNGVEYRDTLHYYNNGSGWRYHYLGNGSRYPSNSVSFPESDYPFLVMNLETENDGSTMFWGEDDSHTIQIYETETTLKQIDPKFIPSEYVTEEELNNATSNIITSYNDLEDKPFGEETTPYNCIPEGTVIINGDSYYREEGFIGLGGLGADLKYLVNFNGTEYLCETIGVYEYENYIGNPHYLDESLESNEYPFCILADSYSEVYRIYFDGDADTTAVISLYELVTNTKQIDPKFIPDTIATTEYVTNAINEAIGTALEGEY